MVEVVVAEAKAMSSLTGILESQKIHFKVYLSTGISISSKDFGFGISEYWLGKDDSFK
jgi:hypothetical protein